MLLSALASPLQDEDASSCLLGLGCLAEARAVKSHVVGDAHLTSALFPALLPASPSLASLLCFPGPTQGVQSTQQRVWRLCKVGPSSVTAWPEGFPIASDN